MKVCLLTQHFPPHFEGGTEIVVRAQAIALSARGHDVRVVSGTDRPHAGADIERCEVGGVPVVHLYRTAEEPYDLDLVRPRLEDLLITEVEAFGPDVAHVHHWSTLSSGLVRGLAARGYATVITLHDHFVTCPRFFRTPPDPALRCPEPGTLEPCVACCRPDAGDLDDGALGEALGRRLAVFTAELDAAGALLAPSAAHARTAEGHTGLDGGTVRVLPHGLCAEVSASGAPARSADRPLTALHFGNRSVAKGTLDLVEAMAALPPGSARLVLCGVEVEPGLDERLLAAAGPLPIVLHGAYDPAGLAAFAREADLAAFPSRALESYGLVVDEALALGLPVWVSDRGALPERVGEAGRVLPAGDPAAWTAALREAQCDPALLARQRAAAPAALRTAADAARDLEEIYTELIATRN